MNIANDHRQWTEDVPDISLPGCTPVPIMGYLKALGLFRLVSGVDPTARGYWLNDRFVMKSQLTAEQFELFLLHDYAPSPIIAPWNGGSGFYPKDNSKAFDPLASSPAPRFAPIRGAIEAARAALHQLGLDSKPDSNQKIQLLELCRATFPDDAVEWLDAAFVLTHDTPKYPPLLGTGGNDGRLEFTNNYMQRLALLFDPETGEPTPSAEPWLHHALYSEITDGLGRETMGQFQPAANVSNPWDYVLMLEGALLFAAAATNKLGAGSSARASVPFTVQGTASGYGSSAETDASDGRGELWLPIWSRPVAYPELRAIFSEGRATVGRRPARDGLDFALAIASFGIDRGMDSFWRYGFQVRNGLAYYATPLRQIRVGERPEADLILALDAWLQSLRRISGAPARLASAIRRLETSIFDYVDGGSGRLVDVFIALGRCERELAARADFARDRFIRPLPPLPVDWVSRTYDGTAEYRIAAALAGYTTWIDRGGRATFTPLRARLERVRVSARTGHADWSKDETRDVVPTSGNLEQILLDILERQGIDHGRGAVHTDTERGGTSRQWIDRARGPQHRGTLDDVARFIDGDVDDARILDLLWPLMCVRWTTPVDGLATDPELELPVDAAYGVLKLCFPGTDRTGHEVPVNPTILRLAAHGSPRALDVALRRLRASDVPASVQRLSASRKRLRRSAAAVAIPLSLPALASLERLFLSSTH